MCIFGRVNLLYLLSEVEDTEGSDIVVHGVGNFALDLYEVEGVISTSVCLLHVVVALGNALLSDDFGAHHSFNLWHLCFIACLYIFVYFVCKFV